MFLFGAVVGLISHVVFVFGSVGFISHVVLGAVVGLISHVVFRAVGLISHVVFVFGAVVGLTCRPEMTLCG